MEVTVKQVATFRTMGRTYLNQIAGSQQNKLTYALQKMIARTEAIHEDFSSKENDYRQEYALIKDDCFKLNAKGIVEIDPKQVKEYDKKMKEESDKKVEVDPYITTTVPQNLNLSWYEYFVPFVIADFPEPTE